MCHTNQGWNLAIIFTSLGFITSFLLEEAQFSTGWFANQRLSKLGLVAMTLRFRSKMLWGLGTKDDSFAWGKEELW